MAKPLVIVESPAKAKTIAGYLGSDYTVKASVGHIRDLPRSKDEVPDDKKATHGRLAGIDPDDHFDACYVVPANKKKVVTELKQALNGLVDGGAHSVLVDLSRTTFLDSTTLGVLMGAVRKLRPRGGQVAISCSDPNIRKIFEITLLDRIFAIFDSNEAGISYLRETAIEA